MNKIATGFSIFALLTAGCITGKGPAAHSDQYSAVPYHIQFEGEYGYINDGEIGRFWNLREFTFVDSFSAIGRDEGLHHYVGYQATAMNTSSNLNPLSATILLDGTTWEPMGIQASWEEDLVGFDFVQPSPASLFTYAPWLLIQLRGRIPAVGTHEPLHFAGMEIEANRTDPRTYFVDLSAVFDWDAAPGNAIYGMTFSMPRSGLVPLNVTYSLPAGEREESLWLAPTSRDSVPGMPQPRLSPLFALNSSSQRSSTLWPTDWKGSILAFEDIVESWRALDNETNQFFANGVPVTVVSSEWTASSNAASLEDGTHGKVSWVVKIQDEEHFLDGVYVANFTIENGSVHLQEPEHSWSLVGHVESMRPPNSPEFEVDVFLPAGPRNQISWSYAANMCSKWVPGWSDGSRVQRLGLEGLPGDFTIRSPPYQGKGGPVEPIGLFECGMPHDTPWENYAALTIDGATGFIKSWMGDSSILPAVA